jgi:hypothetical protein
MGDSACNDTPAANIPQLYTQPTFHLPTEFNTPMNLIGGTMYYIICGALSNYIRIFVLWQNARRK